jgi:hypothetical protein
MSHPALAQKMSPSKLNLPHASIVGDTLSFEAVNSAAAVATFLVIAATAIAAILQLRHVRAGNQLASLLAITKREQQADFESHLHFVRTELTHKLDESNYRAGLDIVGLVDRTQHPELHVIAWFEQIGVLVRTRYLEEAVYLDVASGRVAFY